MGNIDTIIVGFDKFLKAVVGVGDTERPSPAKNVVESELTAEEVRLSSGLMRVNHVGEVCAQALYDAQASLSRSEYVRAQLIAAGNEERDHLAWTSERLAQLRSRPSLLNPLWYAGAYLIGGVAALAGDKASLGFVVETERQVEAHLDANLAQLPSNDHKSRAIVRQMTADEREHGEHARHLGAADLPESVKTMMGGAAFIMKKVAFYI